MLHDHTNNMHAREQSCGREGASWGALVGLLWAGLLFVRLKPKPISIGEVGFLSSSSPVHHSIPSPTARERGMAAVAGAGAGAGGGDQMLRPRPRPRPRMQRLPLSDLTNLSVVTRLLKPKAKPRTSPASSASSIGSSTVPRVPTPPPPPALSVSVSVAAAKGKDKATRELQTSTTHVNKIQKISKPKVKTGGVLPGPSSPPSKNTRKTTRKEQPHTEPLISPLFASSKTKVKTGGNVLPDASTLASKKTMKVTREKQPCMEPLISPLYRSSKTKARTGDGRSGASSPSSKKTRKVTSGEEGQADKMELLEEMSCDEESPVPTQFIEERRAYFAEIDAFELAEEFASSGSDAE